MFDGAIALSRVLTIGPCILIACKSFTEQRLGSLVFDNIEIFLLHNIPRVRHAYNPTILMHDCNLAIVLFHLHL